MRQMRTRDQSSPSFSTLKNSHTPAFFQKYSFCHRTQGASDQKSTDAFPRSLRFPTSHSRVSALDPGLCQNRRNHMFPESTPTSWVTTQEVKHAKRTQAQENSGAADPGRNPAASSVCMRVLIHLYPLAKDPYLLTRSTRLRPIRPARVRARLNCLRRSAFTNTN
jgi:hypothetical protein